MKNYGIIERIGEPAMLEQLAEECAELGKAALKLARILRKENPTPVSRADAMCMLVEEAADVELCLDVLDEKYHMQGSKLDVTRRKLKRWRERLKEVGGDDE